MSPHSQPVGGWVVRCAGGGGGGFEERGAQGRSSTPGKWILGGVSASGIRVGPALPKACPVPADLHSGVGVAEGCSRISMDSFSFQ